MGDYEQINFTLHNFFITFGHIIFYFKPTKIK